MKREKIYEKRKKGKIRKVDEEEFKEESQPKSQRKG